MCFWNNGHDTYVGKDKTCCYITYKDKDADKIQSEHYDEVLWKAPRNQDGDGNFIGSYDAMHDDWHNTKDCGEPYFCCASRAMNDCDAFGCTECDHTILDTYSTGYVRRKPACPLVKYECDLPGLTNCDYEYTDWP